MRPYIENHHDWKVNNYRGQDNPFKEIRNGSGHVPGNGLGYRGVDFNQSDCMEVHHFRGENPEIFRMGRDFLASSKKPSMRRYLRDNPTKREVDYVWTYLIPVLDDLQGRLSNGEWDYKGDNEELRSARVRDIRSVITYIDLLSEEYLDRPTNYACEELVWMHDKLSTMHQEDSSSVQDSPFIVMFGNIKESLSAYERNASSRDVHRIQTSCSRGIEERLIRDAAAISGNVSNVQIAETSKGAMQSYIREYMNRYILEGNQESGFCMDLLTFFMARHIHLLKMTASDLSHKSQITELYEAVDHYFRYALRVYTYSLGMPWLCSEFEHKFEHSLKENMVNKIEASGVFYDYLSREEGYKTDEDLSIAEEGLKLSIQKALINRFALETPPNGYVSWQVFNAQPNSGPIKALLIPPSGYSNWTNINPQEYEDHMAKLEDAYHLKDIADKANRVLFKLEEHRMFPIVKKHYTYIDEIDVLKSLYGQYLEGEINPALQDFKGINHNICKHHLKTAIELYSDSNRTVLSCFDSDDLTTDSYDNVVALIMREDRHIWKDLSDDMIKAMMHKTLIIGGGRLKDMFIGEMLLTLSLSDGYEYLLKALVESPHYSSEFLKDTVDQERGFTLLQWAIFKGETDIVKAILRSPHCDASVLQYVPPSGRFTLFLAMDFGLDIFESLISSKHCNTDMLLQTDKLGRSLLYSAIHRGRLDIVRALLKSPAFNESILRQKNLDGDNVLFFDLNYNKAAVLEILLESEYCNSDVLNERSRFGNTLLQEAILQEETNKDRKGIVSLIIRSPGFDSSVLKEMTQAGGGNALFLALDNSCEATLKDLLQTQSCDADLLKHKDSIGYSILHTAILRKNLDAVEAIIFSPGFDSSVLEQEDPNGFNALHLASERSLPAILKALISNTYCSKDILNARSKFKKRTLLYDAILDDRQDIVEAILRSENCDASVLQQVASDGVNLLFIAEKSVRSGLLKAIIRSRHCKADLLSQTDQDGDTILFKAIRSRKNDIITEILSKQCCNAGLLNQLDKGGRNALMLAIDVCNYDAVQILGDEYLRRDMLSFQARCKLLLSGYIKLSVKGILHQVYDMIISKFSYPKIRREKNTHTSSASLSSSPQVSSGHCENDDKEACGYRRVWNWFGLS